MEQLLMETHSGWNYTVQAVCLSVNLFIMQGAKAHEFGVKDEHPPWDSST